MFRTPWFADGYNRVGMDGQPSPRITVVGLGPGSGDHLTVEAARVLASSPEVWVRTARHPAVGALPPGPVVHSFDELYEQLDTFEQVYHAIARRLLDIATDRPVVYAVPGDPAVGETSVGIVLRQAQERGLTVRLVRGISFLEPALSALGWDALEGLQVADATVLAARHHPDLDPDRRALVAQVYDTLVAGDVKLTLLNQYPPDHNVTLVIAAGTARERIISMPLAQLDRLPQYDDLTTLAVPPLPRPSSVQTLSDIVARLRAPDGCPWDREQTHQSLRPHLIEETYEVLEAIEAEDDEALCEELGDLLLQVVLHAQLAAEGGAFRLADVVAAIAHKVIARHPHVFGTAKAETAEEVLANWDAAKVAAGRAAGKDPFASIPRALPALARAQLVQRKAEAAQHAVDIGGIQLAGLTRAQPESDAERQAAIGAALWHVVAVARRWNVDAETALRDETARQLVKMKRSDSINGSRG